MAFFSTAKTNSSAARLAFSSTAISTPRCFGPRGVVFSSDVGEGFRVSANAGVAPVNFRISSFGTFSAQRLFTAIGTNVYDVSFFIPGSLTPALTRGFGSVFTDVDSDASTSIQYFDAANLSLGTFAVPNFTGDATLSFLGVTFDNAIISRVRITSGDNALNSPSRIGDFVAADDFIYGEPVFAVPEPTTMAIFGIGLGLLAVARRRSGVSDGLNIWQ